MSNFSIKEIRQQLDLWRSHNPNHNEKVIPDSILEEVIKIIPNSSATYVAKRLGVDSAILLTKIKSFKPSSSAVEFIDITPTAPPKGLIQKNSRPNKIEYTSSTGTQINFYLPELKTELISTILKDRASC
jgi:hypothetical protein